MIRPGYINKFSNISAIEPEVRATWISKVFLSFDIDWADDDVIGDTIDLVEEAEVKATWFVTHQTPLLDRLRDNPKFELGIHPNFNSFLDGSTDGSGLSAEKVVEQLMEIVPEAKTIRSHSLFQSERLVDIFKLVGLTHISNFFIPHGSGLDTKPFTIWSEMVIVPHCWQDNLALKMELPIPLEKERHSSFRVFDFHPIHVFLNTEDLDRYEHTRHLHQNPEELIKNRYEGEGTRSRLLKLLELSDKMMREID
jgi:hypothetical protein